MQRYEIVVSERAYQMLEGHVLYLAQKSPTAANDMADRILNSIRSLQQMPERFPYLNAELIPLYKYRKLYIEKWYLVLYQIRDKTVYLDYIVDCRQDYAWLIK